MTPSKQVFEYIGVYTLSYPSLQRFDTTNVVSQMIRRRFPDGPSWELLLQSLNTTPVMTSASRSDPLNLRQCCSALFTRLSTIERMLVRDKRPRVLAVLSRAVANVDSIGWVVRIQCPAGKAWNASSPSWSFSRHAAAFGYFGAYERHEMIEGLICRLAPPSRSPEFDSSRVQTNRLHLGYTPHSWIWAGIPTLPDGPIVMPAFVIFARLHVRSAHERCRDMTRWSGRFPERPDSGDARCPGRLCVGEIGGTETADRVNRKIGSLREA